MPVSTTSAAVHIAPVVLKTFFQHAKRKTAKLKEDDKTEDAWDDIFYDEAFHIVKAFIKLGTKNTVESLQSFTNTHVPAPFWCAVIPVKVPLSSCNIAADTLIQWFGPEELKHVVGGERWWQVRGLDFIDAEWVTEKSYLKDRTFPHDSPATEDEKTILKMDHLDRVLLYVHGGAFFWGSINTHRYQVIRYARKIKGRAFAVNYRKAPQYPWPCPLQDVLAASVHQPVPPSKLVFAGDSAGASLCLAALAVLRDLGLPQPAGAVLISPWVDLTHSFPSVMNNTATDIIPPHGFIHKPSPLWPVNPKPDSGRVPGHADKLKPDVIPGAGPREKQADAQVSTERIQSQQEMQAVGGVDSPQGQGVPVDRSADDSASDVERRREAEDLDQREPKPPKVLMEDPSAVPLELRAQIQLYATTEQLSHPLVSPIMQSSLGNLCPLYIIGGNGECLRDEIMYVAHKAAHPKDYPVRQGILRDGHRQKENAEKFQTPTKVHLQIYDDMCHVLTIFTFTPMGKYAYRSIAQFIKHVTDNTEEHLERNPFPELHRPPSEISASSEGSADGEEDASKTRDGRARQRPDNRSDVELYRQNEIRLEQEVQDGNVDMTQDRTAPSSKDPEQDVPNVLMIRERVDVSGSVRVMEPVEEIAALRIPPQEIGVIKEAPVKRWLAGQDAWDKKYRYTAETVLRQRKHYEEKARKLLEHAQQQGSIHEELALQRDGSRTSMRGEISSVGDVEPQRRWGPLDLKDEQPPPTAIAGRRDTHEAVALLRTNVYHSAPVTHIKVPKLRTSDAVRAALDPHDHPIHAPQQSVSEQQVRTRAFPMHGLRIWQSLVELFMRKSTKKVENGAKHASSTLRAARDKFGFLDLT
ncbi:alpha/beta-hydrolase [Epithele typhae]|uniref:alpha/beta-hydrolase n=1 Tax=Epithele typhae TaxID=378194 RepID=UPI0020074E1A|nr:alpha/beta-hydrolase [Epithele typhae]KAH9927178.1 alpha/beta-hydrolase [Epithele typhae]